MNVKCTFCLVGHLVFMTLPVLAQGAAPAGKGPPECSGPPGALLGVQAQVLQELETPPGQAVKEQAKANRGASAAIRGAESADCGIGALPQAESSD